MRIGDSRKSTNHNGCIFDPDMGDRTLFIILPTYQKEGGMRGIDKELATHVWTMLLPLG